MKYIKGVLAAASLFVVTGTIGTAQADNDHNGVTLYPPYPVRAGRAPLI
jgi:hypothetical protein